MDTFIEILTMLFYAFVGILIIDIPVFIIYLTFLKIIKNSKNFSDLFKETFKSKKKIFLLNSISFSFLIIIAFVSFNFSHKIGSPMPPDYEVTRLVEGKFAYNIADTMKVGASYRAIVTITKALNDSILFLNLDSSKFVSQEIKVSSKVKVILLDPADKQNFSITSLNTDEQLVDDSSNTVWSWGIMPLRSGKNELLLRATIKVLTDLGETPKDIPVFEKTITVEASPLKTFQQFFQDNWQWIAGTILIPLLIWIYQKKKMKKKKSVTVAGFSRNVNSK